MRLLINKIGFLLTALLLICVHSQAQKDASVNARIDAMQITVGDQARVFIEAEHNIKKSRIQWATIPDSFDHLEVVEKGKIDTVVHGDIVIYKQRLLITGFDSGVFQFPSLAFTAIPNNDSPYVLQTDSFRLLVQTVSVDTTKSFKSIKGIIYVKTSWEDYLIFIVIGGILILIIVLLTVYFLKRKKAPQPIVKKGPTESLEHRTLRKLAELEKKNLWQTDKIKEYYTELTDIIRTYIEERFHTPAMELTTDELLYKAKMHKNMQPYRVLLENILTTADLAKFAKAQPLPEEHTLAMENARQFVISSKPVVTETPNTQS
jgi:hypothetical protein